MVLDTTLLNTQHYKVRFKGKVEQSWEWSSALPYTLVVAIEKGAFRSPSTMVANFTFLLLLLLLVLLHHFGFFSPALADGFLLVFKWQQVSSRPQDSSQYSTRSQ